MKISAFSKDILRTISKEGKRFFAIIIITILGVTMFSGLMAACMDLRKSADIFYDRQKLHDFNIASTLGLTDDDVQALLDISEVSEAEGIYTKDVQVVFGENTVGVSVRTLAKSGIDEPYVIKGHLPQSANETAVTEEFLNKSGLALGDKFTIDETLGDDEDSAFNNTEFTISGVVIDVTSVDNPNGNTSFRTNGTSTINIFVLPEAIDSDIYTSILLTLKSTSDMFCYGDEYESTISSFKRYIESNIKTQREEARYTAVLSDAKSEIDDAEADAKAELDEAYNELQDGEKKLQDASDELQSGKEQLSDGQKELESGTTKLYEELDKAYNELVQNEQEANDAFASAWAEIKSNRARLDDAMVMYRDGEAQLDYENSRAKLDEAMQQLIQEESAAYAAIDYDNNKAQITEKLTQVNSGIDSINAQKDDLSAVLGPLWPASEWNALVAASEAAQGGQSEAVAAAYLQLHDKLDALPEDVKASIGKGLYELPEAAVKLGNLQYQKALLDSSLAQLEEAKKTADATFEAAYAEFYENEVKLEDGKKQLDASYAEIQNGYAALDSAEKELAAREAEARSQIADGWAQYESAKADGEKELADAKEKLITAQQEITDGEKELTDAREKLDDGWREYEDGKAEAEAEIADARKKLDDIDMATWYIQDRSDLSGYGNISSDAKSIETIGTVFPIVFFTVAILITLTTITRMVDDDRSFIGTYMALGFSQAETKRKYLCYSMTAGIVGGAIGTLGAFIALPMILFSIFDTMYLLPNYVLTFVPLVGILGPLIFLGGILLVTEYACRRKMRHKPATLMRPKAPKAGTRILLERIGFIWSKMNFLDKVTARNIFRYKKRLFMTVFGIAGCTALLLFGFSVKDSVSDLMPWQYDKIFRYDLMVASYSEDNSLMLSYLDESSRTESYINGVISSATLSFDSKESLSTTIIAMPDDCDFSSFVKLYDLDGNEQKLTSGSVYITQNASSVLGFKGGDSVSVLLPDLSSADITVSQVVENYLGNYIYMTQSDYEKYFGEFEPNGVLAKLSGSSNEKIAFADELSTYEGIVSCSSTEALKEDFASAFGLINMVVYVVIVMSAALAFVVLFTLQTTNISEREREIATIKVLGFYDFETHAYINRETYLLSVIGIIIGMPLGYCFAQSLSVLLNLPSIYLPSSLHPISYVYAALLGIAFTITVNLITNRSLNRLDPATALKSVE